MAYYIRDHQSTLFWAKTAITAMLTFAAQARAEERERCAKVAENHGYSMSIDDWSKMTKKEHSAYACNSVAAALRALSPLHELQALGQEMEKGLSEGKTGE